MEEVFYCSLVLDTLDQQRRFTQPQQPSLTFFIQDYSAKQRDSFRPFSIRGLYYLLAAGMWVTASFEFLCVPQLYWFCFSSLYRTVLPLPLSLSLTIDKVGTLRRSTREGDMEVEGNCTGGLCRLTPPPPRSIQCMFIKSTCFRFPCTDEDSLAGLWLN